MPNNKTTKTKSASKATTKAVKPQKKAVPKTRAIKAVNSTRKTSPLKAAPVLVTELNGQPIEIKNEGQKVIYMIRKAYLEGTLSVSANPTPEVQFILNTPVEINEKDYQPEPKDLVFLKEVIKKVDDGTIKLLTPSTLLNMPVYDRLPSQQKAKADYDILILLNKIRAVKKLWDEGARDSYQILNLVHSLRLAKERLESQEGDVFVI